MGRDHTLFALVKGEVYITEHPSTIRRRVKPRKFISILPHEEVKALSLKVKQEVMQSEENATAPIVVGL